ncbi:MAG: RagB/SusD family nutrient uptake outer membrane protein [Odoribacteraceae bacterium]|jgi:tetratricopeptide (TPR) repeat protein|nr:RagB/SusD family nutrient uptake outer membrane protein [Odoribacteraceae bacterium]
MKKNIIYALTLLLTGACSDFLEPKSQTEFTPTQADQLNEVLLGVAYPRPDATEINVLLDLLSDDVSGAGVHDGAISTTGFYDRSEVQAAKILYTWQPEYSRLMQAANQPANAHYDVYTPIYKFIVGANAVIDRVGNVGGTVEEKNNVLAQAYTLRGFYYLQLVNIFGEPYTANPDGLGVPLKITSDVEERTMARNTVGEVYEQILSDLKEAERLFKTLPEGKQFRKDFRVNLPTAQHLLARAYLYMGRWAEAVECANALIARPDFSLINLQDLVSAGYTNVPSSRKYYNFITYDNPECYWLWGKSDDLYLFTKNIIARQMGNNERACAYLMQASQDIVDSFEAGDARKLLYMVSDAYSNADINITRYGALGKCGITLESVSSRNCWPTTGSTLFGHAMRQAEAYLIAAEGNAMLNKQGDAAAGQAAITALNALRSKRFLTANYTPLTLADFADADALVEMTRAERRRELCFESLRWFDQRRQGMKRVERRWYTGPGTTESTNIHYETYVLEENDPGFTLPIPHTVIEKNSYLRQAPTVGAERSYTEKI